MTLADILDNFLNGRSPVPMMLLAVIVAAVVVALLSKHTLGKLNIATNTDITQLRGEIKQLHEETKNGFQQLKENDFYHTNKAMLIMARTLISDQNVYNRIKDSIMENTPDRLRADIREI